MGFAAALKTRLGRLRGRHPRGDELSGLAYWEWRAERYGARSVYHLGHDAADLDAVTRVQAERFLPELRRRLRGDEKLALDFGCGPGRFTRILAEAIGGRAVGVDPTAALLDLAPPSERTEFRRMQDGRVPLPAGAVDVAFVCLVLGGIADGEVEPAAREIARVVAPGGLLLLLENTADKPDARHWHYRSLDAYRALFPDFALLHAGDYDDLGERISILAGRRGAGTGA
jgi:SAM-dependent methyltransferase